MKKKPIIGIAPKIVEIKNKPNVFGSYRTYTDAISAAGGIPVILSPNRSQIPYYVKSMDGLLFTGGGDVHPKYFGGKMPKVKLSLSPDERTRFELDLIKAFYPTQKPMLGVCLGSQTLAIALGGKLIQDIPSELPTKKNHRKGNHKVWLENSSLLRKIVGKREFLVNSRHHQAIKTVGKELEIVAISPDGVVEAVEAPKRKFVLGVQWHPEISQERPESKKIFRAFVRAC